MRMAYLAVLALAFGALHAYQVLGPGFFLYNNVSVAGGAHIVAGVDTNSTVSLMVIKSSDLSAFSDGYGVGEVYSEGVGSGIYNISVPQGNYSVIFEANGETRLAAGAAQSPGNGSVVARIDGSYAYNFTVSSYSETNVTVLASKDFQAAPLEVVVAGSNFSLGSDSVLEFLNLSLAKGRHTLTLHSSAPEEVFILVSSRSALVNPLSAVVPGGNYAMGVGAYGLYNISGALIPYQVATSEVVGTANISTMESTSANYSAYNVSMHAASLQLNVQLQTNYDGSARTYWLQDVADFNESSGGMYFEDNIWNDTLPEANMSAVTVQGSGNVTSCNGCNQTFYAYGYPYSDINYTMPFDVKLVVYENNTGRGTAVSFGYQILGNGNHTVRPLVVYDTVTIPGTRNSTILVTPYYTTPAAGSAMGDYYDAELVFAGEANGAEAIFTSLNATMWIYYLNGSRISPFPSAYTFGLNTAENASGIDVAPGGYGAVAHAGIPDYSRDIIVSNASAIYADYIANTSRYTAPSTTVPQQYLLPAGNSIIDEIDVAVPYILILIIAWLVLVLISISMRRLFGRR